jgi:hypothetical protein
MPEKYLMETMAIFRATLKLIREGKFCLLSLAEVGYHAKVSALAVQTLFESREELIRAVGDDIFRKINHTVRVCADYKGSDEERFLKLWDTLCEHYRANPDVLPFLDHFSSFPFSITDVKEMETTFMNNLGIFLRPLNLSGGLKKETLAYLFHQNVKAAAKSNQEDIKKIGFLFLNGLKQINYVQLKTEEAA